MGSKLIMFVSVQCPTTKNYGFGTLFHGFPRKYSFEEVRKGVAKINKEIDILQWCYLVPTSE